MNALRHWAICGLPATDTKVSQRGTTAATNVKTACAQSDQRTAHEGRRGAALRAQRVPAQSVWRTSSQELAHLLEIQLVRRLARLGAEDVGNRSHGERLAIADVRPVLLDGDHTFLAPLLVPDRLGFVPVCGARDIHPPSNVRSTRERE